MVYKKLSPFLLATKPDPEPFMAALTYLWGLWLLNPWVDTFATGRGYDAMKHIASETVWGTLFLIMGAKMQYAISVKSLKKRRDSCFGLLILWGFIAATIVYSNPLSTGTVVYPLIAAFLTWLYLWLAQQYHFIMRH